MDRTVTCPHCQSTQAIDAQDVDRSDVWCERCGYLIKAGFDAAALSRGAKILWIDDDRLLLSFGKDTLERHGYRTVTATDGPSGIAAAKKEAPDLIIVDIILPNNMDGYEVCRRLRTEPALKETPIILLTALENPKAGLPGGGVGATFMMSKPSRPERILGLIESLLSRKPDLPKL